MKGGAPAEYILSRIYACCIGKYASRARWREEGKTLAATESLQYVCSICLYRVYRYFGRKSSEIFLLLSPPLSFLLSPFSSLLSPFSFSPSPSSFPSFSYFFFFPSFFPLAPLFLLLLLFFDTNKFKCQMNSKTFLHFLSSSLSLFFLHFFNLQFSKQL